MSEDYKPGDEYLGGPPPIAVVSVLLALAIAVIGFFMCLCRTGTHIDLLSNGQYAVVRCYAFARYDCATMDSFDTYEEAQVLYDHWTHIAPPPVTVKRLK